MNCNLGVSTAETLSSYRLFLTRSVDLIFRERATSEEQTFVKIWGSVSRRTIFQSLPNQVDCVVSLDNSFWLPWFLNGIDLCTLSYWVEVIGFGLKSLGCLGIHTKSPTNRTKKIYGIAEPMSKQVSFSGVCETQAFREFSSSVHASVIHYWLMRRDVKYCIQKTFSENINIFICYW